MRIAIYFYLCICLYLFQFSCRNSDVNKISIVDLKVEGRSKVEGMDILNPRFSWKIKTDKRGVYQGGFRILVSSSEDSLQNNIGEVWDSGLISSDSSYNIVYRGKQLKSFRKYFWKVQVKVNDARSYWSNTDYFSMGVLQRENWKAQWIGLDTFDKGDIVQAPYTRLAARYLRKEFPIEKKIKRATAYISGLGLYELYINGEKVGNQVLAPGPMGYDKAIPYNSFDVTNLYTTGSNAIGVILGNGRYFSMRFGKDNEWLTGIPAITHYGYPKLLFQSLIEFTDGTSTTIISDASWKINTKGPIIANSEYDGEEYDANLDLGNWLKSGYTETDWKIPETFEWPNAQIVSQLNENIAIKEQIEPKSIHRTQHGTYILDMGQNMVGWIQMSVKGNTGDTIKLVFSETLKSKDSLYLANIRNAKVTDKYIFGIEQSITWEPRFTYHGFRYVEIHGLSYTPKKTDFIGKVVYDDIDLTGSFETSSNVLNKVYNAAVWTMKGNYRGMPTDCPQRDERHAWLGDRSVNSYGESFVFDNARHYAKWMKDIEDAQRPSGSIPDVAPTYWKFYNDNVTWPSTFLIIPEMLRQQFGDEQTYRKHYTAMKKWIEYMWKNYMIDSLMPRDTYGDWCLPPESPELIHSKDSTRNTDGKLLGSAYFYYSLKLMEKYARLQQMPADEQLFSKMSEGLRNAFNKKYYNPVHKYYSNNTVTSNLLPISFGIAPEEDRDSIFRQIINRTTGMYNSHISTGLVGGQWMMRGLSDFGRSDLALTIATNNTYPSWGYMIEQGATTIWELWNGNTANPAMNSGNHVMLLGDLIIWMYEYLAGIKSDNISTGFKKVIMKPQFQTDLNFVKAGFRSPYGKIVSEWKKEGNRVHWLVTIPANSTAELYFPISSISELTEGGKKLSSGNDFIRVESKNGLTVAELGSGTYQFEFSIQ